MTLKLFNTLSNSKEEFKPNELNKVQMYACGITVSDFAHIGHARQAIVYDVFRKYLEYLGYDVTYVRNYTDVDDKIINKAREKGMDPIEYSKEMICETDKDFENLGVGHPTITAKVSDNIETIINFINVLIEKGYAYATEKGDVYFSVKKFPTYGKLSNRKIDELVHGVRKDIDETKNDPLDFALWKSEKDNEVSWNSPWGKGRPGWHIECSAMSIKYLGENFDIHGGGRDLVFPHHENEIAQSEAFTGKKFANYWIHNGLITIDGQKMSKSLGNSITIREVLGKYHPEVIRFSMVNNHYSSNVDLGYDAFDAAEKRLYYFYKTLEKVDKYINQNPDNDGVILNPDIVNDIETQFQQAMNDDFNTALAISNLSPIFKYMNDLLKKSNGINKNISTTLKMAREKITKVCEPLIILREEPSRFITITKGKYIKNKTIDIKYVDELVNKRIEAKKNKNYSLADSLRTELDSMGVIVQDNLTNSEWDIKELFINDAPQKK